MHNRVQKTQSRVQYTLTIKFLNVVWLDEMHNREDVKTLSDAEVQHLLVLSFDLSWLEAVVVDGEKSQVLVHLEKDTNTLL